MNERQQKQLNRELINAVIGGDLDDIQYALDAGGELTAVDRLKRPLLCIAATQGQPGSVDVLIRAGADVNGCEKEQRYSPLHSASICGNLEAANSLIAAGANVASVNHEQATPLHFVAHASRNRRELVNLLIQEGANIQAPDKDGNTPLHAAARHSNGEMAQALLAHGADPDCRNLKGKKPSEVFAKFRPAAGTLDAKDVFQSYERSKQLTQVAHDSRSARTELASVDECQARRGRGRFM